MTDHLAEARLVAETARAPPKRSSGFLRMNVLGGSANEGHLPLAPISHPPIRDSSRSRSRWMRRMTSGEISPRLRREIMASLSAASSSRRQFRQVEELPTYSSVVPPA